MLHLDLVLLLSLVAGVALARVATPALPLQSRVSGGNAATPGQFPFIVAIVTRPKIIGPEWQSGFCGGSLISKSIVITAAHCIESDKPVMQVVAGAQDLMAKRESALQIRYVDKYLIHEYYSGLGTIRNDIALLHVAKPFDLNKRVTTIALPYHSDKNKTFVGEAVQLCGFGYESNDDEEFESMLRFINTTVVDNAVCEKEYKWRVDITETQICTSGKDKEGVAQSACWGDSGGPLVASFPGRRFVLLGVISFGSPAKCSNGETTVFARMTSYIDWVERNMKRL